MMCVQQFGVITKNLFNVGGCLAFTVINSKAFQRQFRIIFNEPHDPLTITISVGVGSHTDGEVFADVFKRVDDALYEAKKAGRNRCVPAV